MIPGKFNPQIKEVHIIGSGISGLLMAYHLKKSGYKVTVFEKDNFVGGKIQSHETQYGIVETAANAIYLNQDFIELLDELNIPYLEATPKLKKLIWNNGPKKIFSFKLLKTILVNLFKKHPPISNDLSVADFFKSFLTTHFVNNLLSPALSGIYALPAEKIHFKSLFKHQITSKTYIGFFIEFIKNRSSKGKSISFEKGMSEFIKGLSKDINITFNSNIEIDSHVNTIVCTEAFNAGKIIEKDLPIHAQILKSIEYIGLQTTTLFTSQPIVWLKNSFGVLFPFHGPYQINGILVNHEIFKRKNLKNYYSYTIINQLNSNIRASDELKKVVPDIKIEYDIKTKWEKAIPCYNLNRYEQINKLFKLDYNQNISFMGNYINGISIREINSLAKLFAQTNVFNQEERIKS
jgi:oxygen-dependent protoporphyrinogen oxidase